MVIWIIAVCVLGAVALVGFYQGALRAAVSTLGIAISWALAIPTSGVLRLILPAFGLRHEVLLTFIPPLIMFVIFLTLFKTGAYFLQARLDTFFKYKASDTHRGLFERMNRRVGTCIGLVNGFLYLLLLGVLLHIPGYYSMQMGGSDKDSWLIKSLNVVNRDMESTRFTQALAPFVPVNDFFYGAVDVLSYIYHTPLLQQRLSLYPVLLPVAEEARFQEMSRDRAFQEFWLGRPSIGEFAAHDRIKTLVGDNDFYTNMVGLLEGSLADFKSYLETGASAKYSDEPVVGRWMFSLGTTFNLARRNKPNMNINEKKFLRAYLEGNWQNSVMTAYLDNRLALKRASGATDRGRWTHAYGPKYTLNLSLNNQDLQADAVIDGRRITVSYDKYSLIFRR